MCHRLLRLLVSRGSCSSSDGHLWPSVASWLQPSTAGQSLGISGGTGGQVVSLCGTFLQSFLYICLQLRFKIAPRGLARGFGRCGRNSTNNLVEPDLNAGNFSQASWKTEVLSWICFLSQRQWHVQNTYTFAACVGERICSLFIFLLSVERWCCSVVVGGSSVEKGSPGC